MLYIFHRRFRFRENGYLNAAAAECGRTHAELDSVSGNDRFSSMINDAMKHEQLHNPPIKSIPTKGVGFCYRSWSKRTQSPHDLGKSDIGDLLAKLKKFDDMRSKLTTNALLPAHSKTVETKKTHMKTDKRRRKTPTRKPKIVTQKVGFSPQLITFAYTYVLGHMIPFARSFVLKNLIARYHFSQLGGSSRGVS